MGKTFNRFTIPKATPRQPSALAAKMRNAGAMKHRNDARGGSRNLQADYLDQIDEDDWEEVG